MTKLYLVLIGPPSCGKGTQGELLVDAYKSRALKITPGDLLRAEIEAQTELGRKIKDVIESGNLVTDDQVFSLVKNALANSQSELVILDGYPRTVGQAKLLDNYLENETDSKIAALHFQLSTDELYKRFENRYNCVSCGKIYNSVTNKPLVDGVCDNCGSHEFSKRADDNREAFATRMQNYVEKTQPLMDFYSARDELFEIDANQTKETVYKNVVQIIEGKGI